MTYVTHTNHTELCDQNIHKRYFPSIHNVISKVTYDASNHNNSLILCGCVTTEPTTMYRITL